MAEKSPVVYQKLLEFQKNVEKVKKTKNNPYFNSAYFDINVLLETVKKDLNNLGLVLTQSLCTLEGGKLGLRTLITSSEDGSFVGDTCPIPDTIDAQKAGSAITYFRRYALQALLGLEAEDDDGNAAAAKAKPKVSRTFTPPAPEAPVAKPAPTKTPLNQMHVIGKNKRGEPIAIDPNLPPFGPGSGDNDTVLDDILG